MNYIKVLSELIETSKILRMTDTTSSMPSFKTWQNKTEWFLQKRFGLDSYEYKAFEEVCFGMRRSACTIDEYQQLSVEGCTFGLLEAEGMLEMYLEDELDNKEVEAVTNPSEKNNPHVIINKESVLTNKKVFIVHGHNGEIKEAVARLVEKQGFEAVILHEKANEGSTIIEKFEKNSDVSAAICLFTADDLGKANAESEYNKRARQNVIFEAGYFIGKLGRKHVIIISDSGIEIPSDMQGVVYTNTSSWRFSVLQELKAMGFEIDYNKLDY